MADAGNAPKLPTCAECLAFDQRDGDLAAKDCGTCRRYAPFADMAAPGTPAVFPVVRGDDWCLQHRQTVEPYELTFIPADTLEDGRTDG